MVYRGDKYYIEEVLKGNVNAFSHIVDRHKDNAFNLALKICGRREEAEEVAQDAFLKAYRSLSGFRHKCSFTTWLYRIVYNTSVSSLRGRNRDVLSLEDFPADAKDFMGSCESEEEAEREYRNALVNFAMQKLEAEERALITFFYYDELSVDEIMEITGISKQNIKTKLFRARKKMLMTIERNERITEMHHG